MRLSHLVVGALLVPSPAMAWDVEFYPTTFHLAPGEKAQINMRINSWDLPSQDNSAYGAWNVLELYSMDFSRPANPDHTGILTCSDGGEEPVPCWRIVFKALGFRMAPNRTMTIRSAIVLKPKPWTPLEGTYEFSLRWGPQCVVNGCQPTTFTIHTEPAP